MKKTLIYSCAVQLHCMSAFHPEQEWERRKVFTSPKNPTGDGSFQRVLFHWEHDKLKCPG